MQRAPSRRAGRRYLVLLICGLLTGFLSPTELGAQEAPARAEDDLAPLWHDLDPGRFAIGFRAEWMRDATRSGPGESEAPGAHGRPLRVFVWYPAVAGTGRPMTFGDYLEPSPPDSSWRVLAAYLHDRDAGTLRRQFSPSSDSAVALLRRTAVPTRLGARRAEGTFPIVLHSLGRNDYQQESPVLWEYLASHGYVVVVVPQLGVSDGSPGLAFGVADMELQVEDMAFALAALPGNDDAPPVAVVGHSSGGIAALLLARREPRVRAIVGLDASFATSDGRALLDSLDYAYPAQTAPLLDLYAFGKRDRETAPLDEMVAAERFAVGLGGRKPPHLVTHFDFQDWPLYGVLAGVEDDRGAGARPAAFAADAFLDVCRLTRSFLDHQLGGNPLSWTIDPRNLALGSDAVSYRTWR